MYTAAPVSGSADEEPPLLGFGDDPAWTLSGPADPNLVEGRSYELTATAGTAVESDTTVESTPDWEAGRDRDDDFGVALVVIEASPWWQPRKGRPKMATRRARRRRARKRGGGAPQPAGIEPDEGLWLGNYLGRAGRSAAVSKITPSAPASRIRAA